MHMMATTTLTDAEQRLYKTAVTSHRGDKPSERGHERRITALAWSPTNNVLASGSADTTVRTWTFEPSGGLRDVHAHRSHTGTVDSIAWNPADCNLLASAASDRNLILWDIRTGKQASAIAVKGAALCVQWAHDGSMLAVGTRDDMMYFVDARKAAVIGSYQCSQELNEFVFSPSGLVLAGTGLRGAVLDEGNITVIDVQRTPSAQAPTESAGPSNAPAGAAPPTISSSSGLRTSEMARVRGHAAPITSLKPSSNWSKLATGGGDGLVCLWDAAELACTSCIDRADGQVRAIAWSGSGSHLAIASGDTNDNAKMLDIVRVDGTLVRRIAGTVSINHVAWCAASPLIAFAYDDPGGTMGAGRGDYAIKLLAA